jgi:hypothetical protein
MIDSFMDRQKRSIVIDRVLTTSDDGTQELITNPADIKSLTNDHFQNCPGGHHINKEIPLQWQEQYTPRSDIDASIYADLMTPPSEAEWYAVINKLPNDKAAGPSGITNEMLKHLGPLMANALWKYICKCIELNNIPQAWREAFIYPIPKPKEWQCNLNNTRPITLLETTRKAMVRVLNNRLADSMVQHNILQGHQFAGLPNKSTFEPLRIINEIIQDAKEQNKEIWVLS